MTGFLGKVGMAVPAPAQHEEPGSREGCMGRALVYSCPVFSAQRAQLWLWLCWAWVCSMIMAGKSWSNNLTMKLLSPASTAQCSSPASGISLPVGRPQRVAGAHTTHCVHLVSRPTTESETIWLSS